MATQSTATREFVISLLGTLLIAGLLIAFPWLMDALWKLLCYVIHYPTAAPLDNSLTVLDVVKFLLICAIVLVAVFFFGITIVPVIRLIASVPAVLLGARWQGFAPGVTHPVVIRILFLACYVTEAGGILLTLYYYRAIQVYLLGIAPPWLRPFGPEMFLPK